MKALFFGLPLHGHTNPSLPLVRALVDRGDDVLYVSTDAFADRIREAGARFRPYRNAFLADLRQLPDRTDALAWLLMRTTGEVLSEELDDFRAERPDYVIMDSVAPWGQWIGDATDRAGGDVSDDVRHQPARARVGIRARDTSEERAAVPLEAPAHRKGLFARTPAAVAVRRPGYGHHASGVRVRRSADAESRSSTPFSLCSRTRREHYSCRSAPGLRRVTSL